MAALAAAITCGRCPTRAAPCQTTSRGLRPESAKTTIEVVAVEFFHGNTGDLVCVLFIILFRAGGQIQSVGPLFLKGPARAVSGSGCQTDQVSRPSPAATPPRPAIAFVLGSVAGGYFTSWLDLRRSWCGWCSR